MMHALRVLGSVIREHAKRGSKIAQAISGEGPRSPHWPTVEHHFKKLNPTCAACGGTERIQIHHKKPFHLHPELELADGTGEFSQARDADGKFTCNLISGCMSAYECHLKVFHGDDFKAYNPNVVEDAATVLSTPSRRAEIEAKAKQNRLMA